MNEGKKNALCFSRNEAKPKNTLSSKRKLTHSTAQPGHVTTQCNILKREGGEHLGASVHSGRRADAGALLRAQHVLSSHHINPSSLPILLDTSTGYG